MPEETCGWDERETMKCVEIKNTEAGDQIVMDSEDHRDSTCLLKISELRFPEFAAASADGNPGQAYLDLWI